MAADEQAVPTAQVLNNDNEFWIFGYGSLIWKPPPSFDRRVPGYIKGYVRRFWQASEDHRGTPANPGRVVTLVERGVWDTLTDHHSVDDVVWGVAYRIKESEIESVKEYLDIREINGYSIHQVEVHQSDSLLPSIMAIVYIGTPSNPQFVGNPPPDADDLARHIYSSRGPSGNNREYLNQLYQSLVKLHPNCHDNHVDDLQRRVALIEEMERKVGHQHVASTVEQESTDGQEEVEKTCHSAFR